MNPNVDVDVLKYITQQQQQRNNLLGTPGFVGVNNGFLMHLISRLPGGNLDTVI